MGKLLCRVGLILLVAFGSAYGKFTTKGVNFWSAPDHTRVVVALSRPSKVKSYITKENVIVLRFNSRIRGAWKRVIKVNDSLISKIRIRSRGNRYTVFIHLKKKTNFKVFTLRRYKRLPFRIVVDVLKPREEIIRQKKRRIKYAKSARKKHKYIVVIDPGHGGSDPGAIGLGGVKEKDIVFDISRRVVQYCNRDPQLKAFLTRTGDYYISLEKRVEIAHDYGADLFISVHSNKAPSSKLKGIMAFTLSPRGMASGLAKLLQDVENAEDMVSDLRLSKRNRSVNKAVLKVAYDFSKTEGERAAKLVLEYVSHMVRMENRGLRRAAFKVLKNPGIPSFLLEVGFLSNREDVNKLRSPSYRDRIAYSIYRGIKAFFTWRDRIKKEHYYTVKNGDTLWKIAKIHNTTVKKLVKLNNLKDHRLYPGMKLAVP